MKPSWNEIPNEVQARFRIPKIFTIKTNIILHLRDLKFLYFDEAMQHLILVCFHSWNNQSYVV